jgi:serine/threonine-protein kinase
LPRVAEAKYAAQRALVIDPQLAEGWASLGVLADDFDHDYRLAEVALEHAVRLKPSYAVARLWLGTTLRRSGREVESVEHYRRAAELDPIGGQVVASYAETLGRVGRWTEAREIHQRLYRLGWREAGWLASLVSNSRTLSFPADEAEVYARDWASSVSYSRPGEAAVIGRAMLVPGLRDEAGAVLERMEVEGVRSLMLAQLFMALDDRERAITLLQRAFDQGDPGLIDIGPRPIFTALRSDPRFVRVLQELNLPIGESNPDDTAVVGRTDRR